VTYRSLVWSSADAREWSEPVPVGDPDVWLWRVTWNLKQAYSMGYSTRGTPSIQLYTSADESRFSAHSGNLVMPANRARLRFSPAGRRGLLLATARWRRFHGRTWQVSGPVQGVVLDRPQGRHRRPESHSIAG